MGAKMRSYFWRASLALAAMVLPALGGASPGPFKWKGEYNELSSGATVVDWWAENANGGDGAPKEPEPVDLGFDFQLYGQTFNQVRIGPKGYVALGYDDPKELESIEPATALASPKALNDSGQPGNVIAVWWGEHECDPTSGVRYQPIGTPPTRIFKAEWRCSVDGGEDPVVEFKAQIHIYENSSVVQLHYGPLDVKEDNPPDWTQVRAGIKNHNGSEFSDALDCSSCRLDGYPGEDTVVQYGVWLDNPTWSNNKADLYIDIEEDSVAAGVDADGGSEVAWVDFNATIRNVSEHPTTGPVRHRAFLSRRGEFFVSGTDVDLREGGPDAFAGWPDPLAELPISSDDPATPEVETRIVVPNGVIPQGKYFLCVQLEGAGTSDQMPMMNDISCHPDPLKFGPDLTGKITSIPAEARPMEPFTVGLTLENVGNRPVHVGSDPNDAPVTFEVHLADPLTLAQYMALAQPEGRQITKPHAPDYDRFVGKLDVSLGPGEEVEVEVEVMIPFASFSEFTDYPLQLHVGSSWTSDGVFWEDADTTNNIVLREDELKILLPEYLVEPGEGKFDLEMPVDCVMGEPVWGRYEICNLADDVAGFAFDARVRYRPFEVAGPTAPETGIAASLLPYCSTYEETATARISVDDDSLCPEGSYCAQASCWTPCDPEDSQPNNGCDDGFKCLRNPYILNRSDVGDYSCVPYLEPSACFTYEYAGTIPTHEWVPNESLEEPPVNPYEDPELLIPIVMPNETSPMAGGDPQAPYDEENPEILCQFPRADLEPVSLPTVTLDVVAGNPFPVERRIRNIGTLPAEFEYGYYLSPVPELSAKQWPVPVVGSLDELGRATIARKVVNEDRTTTDGVDQRTDLVVVPGGTPAGEYHFGIVVDPHEKIGELNEQNNTLIYPMKIRVLPPDLEIETSDLPSGTEGVRYNHTLWASGGMGGHRWEKGAGFPAWLDLDPATGHLSGIPTEARDHLLSVKVRSGAIEARKNFVLRIHEPEGTLSIPQHVLPVAVVDQTYGPVELKANGGKPPYTWTTSSIEGTGDGMPAGFCSEDGVIRSGQCGGDLGLVPKISAGAYRFLATVTDSRGGTDEQEFTIHIAGATAFTIATETIAASKVGTRYQPSCIEAKGGNEDNYEWTVTGLPRGLVARPSGPQVCIEGMAEEFGAFMVNVTVTSDGLQASRMFTLEISNQDVTLEKSHLGEFSRGSIVDEGLDTNPPDALITIIQGRLPSGLELMPDNRIRGTISPNAEPGNYSVLLELRSESGQVSPAGLGITVRPDEREVEKKEEEGGCGSSATGSSTATGLGFGAVLLGLYSMRSRRRAAESN